MVMAKVLTPTNALVVVISICSEKGWCLTAQAAPTTVEESSIEKGCGAETRMSEVSSRYAVSKSPKLENAYDKK
ncbi:hypothetical protein M433DRAFT_456536 [Acidomyces richmondensis BFW]|nr:hypothetical protein M433DRAFT_456536 [Acidomyces richmondensis BFW]